MRAPSYLVSGEAVFVVYTWSFCCRQGRGAIQGLFCKDSNPNHEGSILMIEFSPKDPIFTYYSIGE